jgi:sulfatase modifying factor 1
VKRAALVLPEMIPLSGGTFLMGNDVGRTDERPAHLVEVGRFRVALRPVSNAEYEGFLRDSGRAPPRFWTDENFRGPARPVVGISWFDAVAYCEWLTRSTGEHLRLPTEAEREFACLGGQVEVDWPWGNDLPESRPELAQIASLSTTHEPSEGCANAYGLLCMAENVHEWCSDWYDPAYYAVSPSESPKGPPSGRRRASRGGAWRHQIKFNRCSARSSLDPSFQYNDYGFRVFGDA